MPEDIKHKDPSVQKFVRENLSNTEEFFRFQDPTNLSFKLLFQFNDRYGLLDSSGSTNTALGFLRRIGDTTRQAYLEAFINLLKSLNSKTPWFFQTIEGLDSLWKRDMNKFTLDDNKVSIGCLESVDLRMTAFIDLYRKACFDWKNRREVVPVNLRRFDMWIYVYDPIIYNDFKDRTDAASSKVKEEQSKLFGSKSFDFDFDDDLNIGRTSNKNLFKLTGCEFMTEDSFEHLSKVSNSVLEAALQKFSISYLDKEEENVYNMYLDGVVSDNVVKALRSSALNYSPIVFPNPTTGDGTVGFYAANNDIENIQKPDNILRSLGDSIADESQSFSNSFLGDFNTLENLVDPSTLVSIATVQLSNLAESLLGRLILSNIFADISDSLGNESQALSAVLETLPSINSSSSNPGDISLDPANNEVFSIFDVLSSSDLNIPSTLDEIIEANSSNSESTVSSSIESNIQSINDSTSIQLESASNDIESVSEFIEDSVQNSIETLSDSIEESLAALGFQDSVSLSLNSAAPVLDDVSISLEESSLISDDNSIELNSAETFSDDISNLEITLNNLSSSIEESLEESTPIIVDPLDLTLDSAASNSDDLSVTTNPAITIDEDLGNVESDLNISQDNLGSLDERTFKNDPLDLILLSPDIASDSVDISLSVVNLSIDSLDFRLNAANVNAQNIDFELTSVGNLENSIDFNVFEASSNQDSMNFSLIKAKTNEDDLSFSVESPINKKENIEGASLIGETSVSKDSLDFKLVKGSSLMDSLQSRMAVTQSIKDVLSISNNSPEILIENTDLNLIAAPMIIEVLNPEALDAFIPNYINPLDAC